MAGVDPVSSSTTSTSTSSSSNSPTDPETRNRANAIYRNNIQNNQNANPRGLDGRVNDTVVVPTPEMRAAAMSVLRSA